MPKKEQEPEKLPEAERVTVTGVVIGRYVDGGTEYVRIKGVGFEEQDATVLIPAAWVKGGDGQ